MNILVLGGGGREHALVLALSKSPSTDKLFCAPGNPGIFQIAEKAEITPNDFEAVKQFCRNNSVDLLVVGPEQPLAEGIVDFFAGEKTQVFGPSKAAAQLECSKDFAKQLMMEYGVPTAAYRSFTSDESQIAEDYIRSHSLPIVLKADGLAAGKGVIIATSTEEAVEAISEMFRGTFGIAGAKVVVEEFMQGDEASIFAICDGKDYITMAPAQDHKRALDGDKGKNTGGMGAYAPAPLVTDDILLKVKLKIIEPVLQGMINRGTPFIGCLYCGLMIKDGEPKVVEFNARFGDPETQVVLPLFEGDLAKLLFSAAAGKIDKMSFTGNSDMHAVCVILASGGYPDSFEKGFPISGLQDSNDENLIIYHAGTKEENGNIVTSGGRVLGVTAISGNLKDSITHAYLAIDKIDFKNKYFRRDIGYKGVK
jgi:phosphoribosylamine--glycine ligase